MSDKPQIKFISSWDDYSPFNDRLAELLSKHSIPAIWFIDFRDRWGASKQIHEYDKNPLFEIGSHTMTHPQDLKLLQDSVIDYEVRHSARIIDDLIGKKPRWFCYPRGRHDKKVETFVRAAGYQYARTTKVGELGYHDPMAVHTSVHVYPRAEYEGVEWQEAAQEGLTAATEGDVFHIWGHSWEIDKLGQWEALEAFFERMNNEYTIIPAYAYPHPQ